MSENTECVTVDTVITFSPEDIVLDPHRYVGNNPLVTKALRQNALADELGYLTEKGREYFANNSRCRYATQTLADFLHGCDDNGERETARRRYCEYVAGCPYKVVLSFVLEKDKFKMKYHGDIDPLLVELGFFDENGYCTAKMTRIFCENTRDLKT